MLNALFQRGVVRVSRISTTGKVVFIIAVFLLISFWLTGIIYLQGPVLDGVRAYVRGEGLWAKAEKDAVRYLERYTYTGNEADYRAFENAIQVNMGDKNAREALYEKPANLPGARAGFLQGQNDPLDVHALIWFFLHFQSISYMQEAITIWVAADDDIARLGVLGRQIRSEMQQHHGRSPELQNMRIALQHLNTTLLDKENRFSIVLGEGARWVKATTWSASIALLVLFTGLGVVMSRQIIRGIGRSERNLLISESRFRSLKDSDTIGIVTWHIDGIITEANSHFLAMLDFEPIDLQTGQINWRELTPETWRTRDEQALQELVETGHCTPFEKALYNKAGKMVPVLIGAALLDGDVKQGVAYVMDLRERKRQEEQLRLAATVFAASYDGVMIMDEAMRIISVNQALCTMTGYAEQELLGHVPTALESGYTTPEQYRDLLNALTYVGHWEGDIIDRKKDGALLPVRLSISSVRDQDDRLTHHVAILSDISARKAEEEHLRHIAYHDTLTGLPNRVLFNDRISQLIKRAERYGGHFAVLFFDLDNFKPVNDQYGHEVGDKVLQTVAQRLTEQVRGTDTVTRMGGDEFVILLEDMGDRHLIDTFVAKAVEALCSPIIINEQDVEIGVSVGISLYPENGTTAAALLHHADQAMYHMKNSGKSR